MPRHYIPILFTFAAGFALLSNDIVQARANDIGQTAAVRIASRGVRAHLAAASRANSSLTMEQLLSGHALTVDRNEQPGNACLYKELYAGLMSLDSAQEARDLDIQKRLRARSYYLVMYAPSKTIFDGGRYCVYVDAYTGKVLHFEALLG